MHIPRIPLFRIWYSSTYTALNAILFILLAVTPGDTIYQSIRTREFQKLFVIGGVYLLTLFIVLLVYSTRLYTNRTVLAAIPKPYIPVEDGEVGKLVRRMIVKQLRRSAIVAWDAKPRDLSSEAFTEEDDRPATAERERDKGHKRRSGHGHGRGSDATIIPVSTRNPPWGHIAHPGWASPSSPDLPNLQYWNVVCELPNLIEAKAVSLAPPDPAIESSNHQYNVHDNTPLLPDAQIVALLQRPRAMGLRDYLGRLASFGLLNPPSLGPRFLAQYEHARFSTQSLTEQEFRDIMAVFAEILNGMTELDPTIVEESRAENLESDDRSLAPSESSSTSSRSGLPYRTPMVDRHSEFSYYEGGESPQTARTALSIPRNLSSSHYTIPRTPSERSAASRSVRIRRDQRSPSTILPNSSTSSLRSAHSVIRLHPNPSEGEIPYQYHFDEG